MLHEMGAFCGSNAGTMLIARFRNKVLAGDTPSMEDLVLLARAFEPLEQYYLEDREKSDNTRRDALMKFAEILGLKSKQGQENTNSLGKQDSLINSVCRYLDRFDSLVKDGANERNAKKRACDETAFQEGIGNRAMRDRINKYMDMAKKIRGVIAK